jgi:LCP family protein required for cell wall assembly
MIKHYYKECKTAKQAVAFMEKYNVNVYVNTDNSAQSINDAADYKFGILADMDRESTDDTINKINKALGKEINIKEYSGVTELFDALLKGKVGAIILNEGYISIVQDIEGYENIADQFRSLYINEIEKKVEEENKNATKDVTKDSFIVYLSGIDTTGAVSTRSRSDVNILMVVNPTTKKILLVSTPRDYYVPLSISKGVKDKLTHAGNYGINVSMDTLEMLYDTKINYYVRLNFTGFKKIIDALGGLDIYCDRSFTSYRGYKYTEGTSHMNGDRALEFARERYAFTEGDRQRGKNQMQVIEKVVDKLTSKAILNNYSGLMKSIGDSMQTNISSDEISSLVKMEVNDMSKWEITQYSVNGTGASSYTYSIPQQKAYVMIPDQSTVNEAKKKIDEMIK